MSKSRVAVTYASLDYRNAASVLGIECINLGFERFLLLTEDDLDSGFKDRNSETLKHSRGSGYWVWKPQVIIQSAKLSPLGAVIMYTDAGVLPRMPADFFSNLAYDSRIHVWETGNQKLVHWTDERVLKSIGLPIEKYSNPLVMGGVIVARNSSLLHNFLVEWSKLCEVSEYLRPDSFHDYRKTGNLVWHRHDQSLLSILVAQNPDWFVIHSDSMDGLGANKVFNIHRNKKIKMFLILGSFPTLRSVRSRAGSKLPKHLRLIARKMLYEIQRKPISTEEAKAVKKSL